MQVQRVSEKQEMNSVAQALINIFSNEADPVEDHSLGLFLMKLYKNNVSAKPKRMNSIRLSRFNAFLYRVNQNYPYSPIANSIIHSSLIAVLNNHRSFLEEEDEQTVASIAKWTCVVLVNSIKRGFYQSVFAFLTYLIKGGKPEIEEANVFDETIRSQVYFNGIELSNEDQVNAREHRHYSITSQFNIKDYILGQVQIKQTYSQLYTSFPDKKLIAQLFHSHIQKINHQIKVSQLFISIFFPKTLNTVQQIAIVLQSLEQNYFSHEQARQVIEKLVQSFYQSKLFFELKLTGKPYEQLLLEHLNYYWRQNVNLIDQFLSCNKINNLAILYFLITQEIPVHKHYIYLPFKLAASELQFKHALIFALALAHNSFQNDKHTIPNLIQLFTDGTYEPHQRAFILKAIHFSLSVQDKRQLYSNIMNEVNISNINGPPSLSFLPQKELKADRLSGQDKKKLLRVLESYQDESENGMKIKGELLNLLSATSENTKKVKQLTKIFNKSEEDILYKYVNRQYYNSHPDMLAALLMALNNKLYLTFIPEPSNGIVTELSSLFIELHDYFAKNYARAQHPQPQPSRIEYFAALFRYSFHCRRKIGQLQGQLGELMSGVCNFKRVNGGDFAEYFVGDEDKKSTGWLWTGKKLLFQVRTLCQNILNFNNTAHGFKKQVVHIIDKEYIYELGFKLVSAYFEAGIQDPSVLIEVLSIAKPKYEFFAQIEKVFSSQCEEYRDLLALAPQFLRQIYPQMIEFLSLLVDSQPVFEEEDKNKKKKKSQRKEKKIINLAYNQFILNNQILFETLIKTKQLPSLFGDPTTLTTFSPLINIISKIHDPSGRLESAVKNWVQTIRVFHCQGEQFEEWLRKVLSYCDLWHLFIAKGNFVFQLPQLQRHFHILSEFLNAVYESKEQIPQAEEKILTTLLLIYQASSTNTQLQQSEIPIEPLKSLFLGYRISSPTQHHYYQCFTCSLEVCQVCLPFLHKHHDVNYLGKDGSCVHDNQRRKSDRQEERGQRREQHRQAQRIQRQLERYQNLGNLSNAFQPSNYSQIRNPRREQDWLMSTFQFPDEQLDFGEHLRKNPKNLGFKQMMQSRLRDQKEKQKQKELIFSRQRQRMERQREQLMPFQKDVSQQKSQIKSCSTKSIKNLHYGQSNKQYFIPQFTPQAEPHRHYSSNIDTKPLMCILLRQLQCHGEQQADREQKGRVTVSVANQRYNFFNKSNYFKTNPRPEYGMMRGMGIGLVNITKKNSLTSNNKFLAYPTPNNGIIFITLASITAKMQKRIQSRAMADFQQERGFLCATVNTNNFSFQPFQILYNKSNPTIMAIVGLTQVGFAVINSEAKLIKYVDSDFKSTEPITKFIWLSKHKNIFAVASGNNIRLGHISEEGRVKTTNRFKVQIDKPIRDFQINNENGSLFVYVIDQDGGLYRAQFNYRTAKALSISDKTLNYAEGLTQLHSLVFADKKIFIASSTGKCYLLAVDKVNGPNFVQAFDLESVLRGNENAKFIKFPTYLSQLQLIQANDSIFSIVCLLKRTGADPKKKGGYLCVVRINSKNSLELIFLMEEDTIESYEILEMAENNHLITAVDQHGSVFCYPYQIPSELLTLRDQSKIPMDENSMKICNRHVKTNNLLRLAKYCEPKRYENFKETKDITGAYKVSIDHPYSIKVSTNQPLKYFWTGVSFTVQCIQKDSEVIFDLFGRHYAFTTDKARQIQIAFDIKDTIQIFTQDSEFAIYFHVNSVKQIKNFKIYGMEYAAESLYKRAYTQLHKIVITHLHFADNSIQQYLQNPERRSLVGLDIYKLLDLKNTHKYTSKQVNLLMKLQLLRESISDSLHQEPGIEQSLEIVRTHLLPQCDKRQYLEKSCWKLIRRICQLALPQSKGLIGHPFEYRTVLDLYYFESCFTQWSNSQQISHFEQLVNVLYALIFKRIGNLYIIFKLYPDLIYELTYFYKGLLQSLKLSKTDQRDQAQLHKLINICPNFVALVCEYYQTLKNKSNRMLDQSEQPKLSPQKMILSLLEEVFCATRKELYREVFISPQVYLQKLYLSPKQLHPLESAISIFEIEDKGRDHEQLKKNKCIEEQMENEKEEEYLELDQESSQKDAMMEQQARQMIEPASSLENSSSHQMDIQKLTTQEKFKRISTLLKNNLLPRGSKLQFIYYQFSFEMSTALFRLDNYIIEQNGVFYIGFLFNLLRMLEKNLEPARDSKYIRELFDAILSKVYSENHSVLFMVLNYFFEPSYHPTPDKKRQVRPSQTKLSQQFVRYLFNNNICIESLFLNFNITKTATTVSFGQAMKFNSFSVHNHLYQLKFLGNLYFNVRLSTKYVATQTDLFKYKILGGVVQYKLRILNNIMYYEGWQEGLEEARVQVAFDNLRKDFPQAITMLAGCSTSEPAIFIKKLSEKPEKIRILEDLLQEKRGQEIEILQMLTIYYAS